MLLEYKIERSGKGRPKPLLYKVTETGCWENVSHSVDKDGYGKIQINGKSLRIHRLVYCLENKVSLLETEIIRHKCDNPLCFNPEHLEIGTIQENVNDRVSRKRGASGEKHGSSKLTNEQVVEIYLAEGTQASIAERYGVTQRMVSNIKRKKNHTDLLISF